MTSEIFSFSSTVKYTFFGVKVVKILINQYCVAKLEATRQEINSTKKMLKNIFLVYNRAIFFIPS